MANTGPQPNGPDRTTAVPHLGGALQYMGRAIRSLDGPQPDGLDHTTAIQYIGGALEHMSHALQSMDLVNHRTQLATNTITRQQGNRLLTALQQVRDEIRDLKDEVRSLKDQTCGVKGEVCGVKDEVRNVQEQARAKLQSGSTTATGLSTGLFGPSQSQQAGGVFAPAQPRRKPGIFGSLQPLSEASQPLRQLIPFGLPLSQQTDNLLGSPQIQQADGFSISSQIQQASGPVDLPQPSRRVVLPDLLNARQVSNVIKKN